MEQISVIFSSRNVISDKSIRYMESYQSWKHQQGHRTWAILICSNRNYMNPQNLFLSLTEWTEYYRNRNSMQTSYYKHLSWMWMSTFKSIIEEDIQTEIGIWFICWYINIYIYQYIDIKIILIKCTPATLKRKKRLRYWIDGGSLIYLNVENVLLKPPVTQAFRTTPQRYREICYSKFLSEVPPDSNQSDNISTW